MFSLSSHKYPCRDRCEILGCCSHSRLCQLTFLNCREENGRGDNSERLLDEREPKQTICPQDQEAYFNRVSSYTVSLHRAKVKKEKCLRCFCKDKKNTAVFGECCRSKLPTSVFLTPNQSAKWFAKPGFLSPLVCARYGWINVERDILQCVTCKAHVSGHLPTASKPSVCELRYFERHCSEVSSADLKVERENASHLCCGGGGLIHNNEDNT